MLTHKTYSYLAFILREAQKESEPLELNLWVKCLSLAITKEKFLPAPNGTEFAWPNETTSLFPSSF